MGCLEAGDGLQVPRHAPSSSQRLGGSFTRASPELKPELEKRFAAVAESSWRLFLDGIDLSRFRDDIDKAKAVELLIVAMEGLQRKYVEQYRDRPADFIRDADRVFAE